MKNIMVYKGYFVCIEYDDYDGIMIGQIVGICDGIGFYVNNVRDLKGVFYEVVDDYIEICVMIGKELQKLYFGCVMFCVDFEIYWKVVLVVELFGKSLNQWVEEVLSCVIFVVM